MVFEQIQGFVGRCTGRLLALGLLGTAVGGSFAAEDSWSGQVLPASGTVVGDRVNVRARAQTSGEVIGQLNFEESVDVMAVEGEWLKIVPPAGIVYYVHEAFLSEGKVKVPTLNVRAGSSINYPVVGQLKRGDAVSAKGRFDVWMKIEPPAGSWAFVHQSMVQTPRPEPIPEVAVVPDPVEPEPLEGLPLPEVEDPPRLPEVRVISGRATPAVREVALPDVGETPVAAVPEGLEVVPLKGQGKLVKREGKLISYLLKGGRPSRFQLVGGSGGRQVTIAYIDNKEGRLKGYVGQRVTIQGHEFWTRGETRPLLVPKSILVLEE